MFLRLLVLGEPRNASGTGQGSCCRGKRVQTTGFSRNRILASWNGSRLTYEASICSVVLFPNARCEPRIGQPLFCWSCSTPRR